MDVYYCDIDRSAINGSTAFYFGKGNRSKKWQFLEYATISAFTTVDSVLIHGTISDNEGRFVLEELPQEIIQFTFGYQLNQSYKKVKLPDSEFGEKEF